ncbi:TraB/GumN family protein [Anaerofustis sp.]|uniref:TraB/GumN family protein n=1 Tax=Anaerofustis sp. TaxID=1872517 RepID=UPI0025C42B18|nr:TraB/GumN family protein [Anaerofustis sp.]
MSENIKHITINNKDITLVGTAHVSKESAREVEEVIKEIKPDNICIELDEGRYSSLENDEKWKDTDIVNVIKEKKTTLLLVNLILSSYQKRIAESFDINSGQEMINAINLSKEMNVKLTLADRDIKTTFLRIFRKMSLWEKMKLLSGLIMSFFEDEELTEEDLENIKEGDFIENALLEISEDFPDLKTYLVDERDIYLSQKIKHADGNKIVAVVGAAHLNGIIKNIEKDIDLKDIEEIPQGSKTGKIIGFSIPLFIIGMIIISMFRNLDTGFSQIISWILFNGTLSALGVIFALGSLPSVLTAFVAAPITSLNPLLAAGWFAGLVEAHIKKPKVSDFENLSEDLNSFKGLWKNRITKILLVVTFANIGSTVGTIVAGADIFKSFLSIF